MNTINSWEAQTRELIGLIDQEIVEAEQNLSKLKQKKWALEDALATYIERIGSRANGTTQGLTQEDVKNKTQREILKLIGSRNNGLIVARHAIKLMKDANVFGNPLNADAAIYGVLNRYPEFVRVGKGLYKMNGHNRHRAIKHPVRSVTGIREAVKELKTAHPEWTKQDVLKALADKKFDFGGKKPVFAIGMAWIYWGYHKQKDVQQTDKANVQPLTPGLV